MFFDIEKDVDKGALSEALSDSAEVTVVSFTSKKIYKKIFIKNILFENFTFFDNFYFSRSVEAAVFWLLVIPLADYTYLTEE
jgi:hypothetical protein